MAQVTLNPKIRTVPAQDRESKRQKLVDESAGAYIGAASDGGPGLAITVSTTEEPVRPTVGLTG